MKRFVLACHAATARAHPALQLLQQQRRSLSSKNLGDEEKKYTYAGRDTLTPQEALFGTQAKLEAIPANVRSITSCGIKKFRVNSRLIEAPVIVMRTLCFEWNVRNGVNATVDDLTIEDFELLKKTSPPVTLIILGTGGSVVFPKPELLKQLRDIAPVEINDTLNGAGLFNILNKEDRYVAACMLPVQSWPESKKFRD